MAEDPKKRKQQVKSEYRPHTALSIEEEHYDPEKANRWIRTHRFTEDGRNIPDEHNVRKARHKGWTPVEGHPEHEDLMLCSMPQAHAEELRQASQAVADAKMQQILEPAGYAAEHQALTKVGMPRPRIRIYRDRAPTEADLTTRHTRGRRIFDMGR